MVLSNSQWLANADTGYKINQSIRFNDDDSAYLTRTPGSEGNRRTFTFSTWVKFATLKADTILFSSWVSSGASSYQILVIDSDFRMRVADHSTNYLITTQKFRDVGSWYHIVWRSDTTDSTSGDRYQLYVNGSRVTAFDTESQPSLNFQGSVNQTQPHYLGRNGYNLSMIYSDLYQAETHFLDGTAYNASFFGETNSDTGQWIPKKYTGGNYGTNGFYLKGQDSSALGDDSSGNGNDFTSSGLAANDQVTDSPTSNHCTLNPLITPATMTFTDGNLALSGYTASTSAYGTFGLSSGKWFWQMVAQTNAMAGIAATPNGSQYPGQAADSYAMDLTNGQKYNNGSATTYGSGEISAGDVIGVAFDADGGTLKFFDSDGNDIGTAFSSLTSGPYFPVFRNGNSANISINFGQTGAFTFTPSGYNSLTVLNFADPAIADPKRYFGALLYTGNGTTGQTVTGLSTSSGTTWTPDWVWIKPRSAGYHSKLFDSVRTLGFSLESSTNAAQSDKSAEFIGFADGGFQVDDNGSNNINQSGITHVAWCWEAGGSGSSNENGATSSTVSVNSTAGFSIVKWTGTASATTIGHSLGSVPKVILIKNTADADSWVVYHESIGNTKGLTLDGDSAATTASTFFNDTSPTSSVFTVGSGGRTNGSSDVMIAYCFAEIPGYSKISSFIGNGNADGQFVNCGFKPAFVITKNISNAGDSWPIADNKRSPFNVANATVFANLSRTETTGYSIDLLSNGFKARTTDHAVNESGATIVYWAFAESPFKTATAR